MTKVYCFPPTDRNMAPHMASARSRIVDYAKSAGIVLWFFSAPFLLVYVVGLIPIDHQRHSDTDFLIMLSCWSLFLLTWLRSFYWVYGALFKLAEARWPKNALQIRHLKEIIDMILRVVIWAPSGTFTS